MLPAKWSFLAQLLYRNEFSHLTFCLSRRAAPVTIFATLSTAFSPVTSVSRHLATDAVRGGSRLVARRAEKCRRWFSYVRLKTRLPYRDRAFRSKEHHVSRVRHRPIKDLLFSRLEIPRSNDISRHEYACLVALECAFRRLIDKKGRDKERNWITTVLWKLKSHTRPKDTSGFVMAYIGSPNEYREEEGFGQTSAQERAEGDGRGTAGLIKELAPTLLSRQTRADTRLPGDICGRSLFLGGTGRYGAAFYLQRQ